MTVFYSGLSAADQGYSSDLIDDLEYLVSVYPEFSMKDYPRILYFEMSSSPYFKLVTQSGVVVREFPLATLGECNVLNNFGQDADIQITNMSQIYPDLQISFSRYTIWNNDNPE